MTSADDVRETVKVLIIDFESFCFHWTFSSSCRATAAHCGAYWGVSLELEDTAICQIIMQHV